MAKLEQVQDFTRLNDTELRVLCETYLDRSVSSWLPRAVLLGFLVDGQDIPENPIDDVRIHQMGVIANQYNSYRSQLPRKLPWGGICDGCCYNHDDMQVVECQVQSVAFRHPNYQKSEQQETR